MKLQAILCAAALAAIPSFATVTGSNVCGLMKVDSQLKNTIVAVPWVEVGSGDAIKVANLVRTDNLTAGDFLYVYDNATDTWFAYVLQDGAWVGTTTVGADGPSATAGANTATLPLGTAIYVSRQDPTKPFFIYGQYQADTAATTVQAGSADAPAYTLVASPKGETFNLNSGKIAGAGADDEIVLPQAGGETYYFSQKNGQWGRYVMTTITKRGRQITQNVWKTDEATTTIPLGTGFWYVSKGAAAKFNW